MAIGSNVPNYLAMANQMDADSLQQTKGMIGAAQQGINLGSKLHDRFQEQAAQEAFQKAWISNDPKAMQRVIAQFPKYGAQMLQMIGVRDDQHRKDVGSMAIQVSGLLKNGDIKGAQDVIRNNANLLDSTGEGSADSIINALNNKDNAGKLENRFEMLSLSTLSPKEIMNWQNEQSRQAETRLRDELAHEDRQQQMSISNARLNEIADFHNQMLDLRRQSILNSATGDAMTDANGNSLSAYDYNRRLLQTGVDPRTNKRATGPQISNAQKWMKGNNDYTSAQETLQQQIEKIDELLTGDNLSFGTGMVTGYIPTALITGKGQNTRNLIDSIRSGEFTTNVQKLRGMGSLSNTEGSKLMDLTAKLDITQSEDILRKQVKAIRDQYKKLQAANQQDAADMGYGQTALNAYTGNAGGADTQHNKAVSAMSDGELLKGLN